jgi:hypothetical protein
MEIILAIVVASAVIFFGALISMGNERQRKAIDGLRAQVVLWAIQDLKIKREHLARTAQISDPLVWLNQVTSKACGYSVNLGIIEQADNPDVLVCSNGNNNGKFIFSMTPPNEIRAIQHARRNRVFRYSDTNPLMSLPKKSSAYECSVLNFGILFDLELAIAWRKLTTPSAECRESLWIYVLD